LIGIHFFKDVVVIEQDYIIVVYFRDAFLKKRVKCLRASECSGYGVRGYSVTTIV
jgi:hypothetical protein